MFSQSIDFNHMVIAIGAMLTMHKSSNERTMRQTQGAVDFVGCGHGIARANTHRFRYIIYGKPTGR